MKLNCPICGAAAQRVHRNPLERLRTVFRGELKWECNAYHVFYAREPDGREKQIPEKRSSAGS